MLTGLILANCPVSKAQVGDAVQSMEYDTVTVPGGYAIVFKDTLVPYDVDTILLVPAGVKYKIRKNPYQTSENFYANLDRYSDKKKVTRLIANAIFRMDDRSEVLYEGSVNSEAVFEPYEGRYIKKIRVIQVPVGEGNVDDTLRQVETKGGKMMNRYHIQTWESVIRKNLLFSIGDTVQPFLLADNERILRQFPFLKDCRIITVPVNDSSDSEVEVLVISQDVFSIGFGVGVGGPTDYDFSLYDLNFLGLGHEFTNIFRFRGSRDPRQGYFGSYKINNIQGSFVEFLLKYQYDFEREELVGSFFKGFLTPSMKYGFGLDVGVRTQFLQTFDSSLDENVTYPVTHEVFDYWIGRQFRISKKDERKTLIISGRVADFDYTERPELHEDTLFSYHDSRFVLGGITLRKIRFQKTALIYRFGIPEDVPYGYVFQLVGGFQRKEFYDRPYVGVTSSFVLPFGGHYMSNTIQFSTFLNDGRTQEGSVSYKNRFISKLKKWGRYKFRIIGVFEYIYGIDRLGTQGVSLDQRIRGFPSASSIKGTHLHLMRMEMELFTPWYFYGFRTVWFFYGEGALLGNYNAALRRNNFYGSFGTGIRIRNENLVFSTFNIRIGYYYNVLPGASSFGYEISTSNPELFQPLNVGKPVLAPFL